MRLIPKDALQPFALIGSRAHSLNEAASPPFLSDLTQGLTRLRANAVQLARSDAREIIARFGRMGGRRLAVAG